MTCHCKQTKPLAPPTHSIQSVLSSGPPPPPAPPKAPPAPSAGMPPPPQPPAAPKAPPAPLTGAPVLNESFGFILAFSSCAAALDQSPIRLARTQILRNFTHTFPYSHTGTSSAAAGPWRRRASSASPTRGLEKPFCRSSSQGSEKRSRRRRCHGLGQTSGTPCSTRSAKGKPKACGGRRREREAEPSIACCWYLN
jgi:hypothetical protein